MTSPLEISLIALGFSISGLLLYRFISREAQAPPPRAKPQKKSVTTATQVDESTYILTPQFFTFLLRKNDGGPQVRHSLNKAFNRSWQAMLEDPSLFPRQPMVLPKLLQAMRSETNNSQALLDIIVEDPGLTAEVLKLANSPVYRNTKHELQSLEYALVMLGVNGLHSLVCSSVMKPIFAKRREDGFNSNLFWEWSLHSAQSAQKIAKLKYLPDPSTVYMLALLTRLAELTILRSCSQICREQKLPCTADAVMPIIEHFRYRIAEKLIIDWGFDNSLSSLLPDSESTTALNNIEMQNTVRAQRFSPEIGSATILVSHKKKTPDEANEALESIGLDPALLMS